MFWIQVTRFLLPPMHLRGSVCSQWEWCLLGWSGRDSRGKPLRMNHPGDSENWLPHTSSLCPPLPWEPLFSSPGLCARFSMGTLWNDYCYLHYKQLKNTCICESEARREQRNPGFPPGEWLLTWEAVFLTGPPPDVVRRILWNTHTHLNENVPKVSDGDTYHSSPIRFFWLRPRCWCTDERSLTAHSRPGRCLCFWQWDCN